MLALADRVGITHPLAAQIIAEVREAVSRWRSHAREVSVPARSAASIGKALTRS